MKNYDHHFNKVAPTSEGTLMENERGEFMEQMEVFEKAKKDRNEKGITPLNVQPLGDRILLYQVIAEEEKTSQGIILTGTMIQESNKAIVVAVGLGKTLENGSKMPMEVKVGDEVIFNKNSCTDITYDGINYKVTSERDIIFIVNRESENQND